MLICGICGEQWSEVRCYCTDPRVLLCSLCAAAHFMDASVRHRPLPCYDVPAKSRCQHCSAAEAVYFCKCEQPWQTYCSECLDEHMASSAHELHESHPAVAIDFLQQHRPFQEFMDRQRLIDYVESEVRANVNSVQTCISAVDRLAKDLTIAIESWRRSTLQTLEIVKKAVESAVEDCVVAMEPYRYQWKIDPKTRLEQILSYSSFSNVATAAGDFQFFRWDLRPETVMSPLMNVLDYDRCNRLLAPVKQLYYAVPRSYRLLSYSVPSISPKEITIQMKTKFKGFSSWCEVSANTLCVSGGCKHTQGKTEYYKEAKLVNLILGVATPMPNMIVARCRHALTAVAGAVFAFGGYNDSYLSSIEKFDPSIEDWLKVGNLTEAKDCVSAAIWQDKIYLVGFGSKKIEVFDPVSAQVSVLPVKLRYAIMNLLAPKYTTLLTATGNELLVLLEQEIMRVRIDTGTTSTVKLSRKMDKSWFCQCLPAIVGNQCFFFNLDQEVWMLDLTTYSLDFAGRIAL